MTIKDEDCIRWRKRRTVDWLCLSLGARGAVEGIVCALDKRGELSLGKRGLPGLAVLLGRPWTEVEPAILEVLAAGRFAFDAERGVLHDPQHVERQELEFDEEPPASFGSKAPSPSAERQRRRRSKAVAQLELQDVPRVEIAVRDPVENHGESHAPDAQRDACHAPSTDVTLVTLPRDMRDARLEVVAIPMPSEPSLESQDTDAPLSLISSLSLSEEDHRDQQREAHAAPPEVRSPTTPGVVLKLGTPLPETCRALAIEALSRASPPVELVLDYVWRKFVNSRAERRFRSRIEVEGRWDSWVAGEVRHAQERASKAATAGPTVTRAPDPADARQRDYARETAPLAVAASAGAELFGALLRGKPIPLRSAVMA